MRKLFHTKRKLRVGPNFQTNTATFRVLPAGVTNGLGGRIPTSVSRAQRAALLCLKKTHLSTQTALQAKNQVYTDHSRDLDMLFIRQHLNLGVLVSELNPTLSVQNFIKGELRLLVVNYALLSSNEFSTAPVPENQVVKNFGTCPNMLIFTIFDYASVFSKCTNSCFPLS